jgi:hypothetical protein
LSRDERDLLVRWIREVRREPLSAALQRRIARRHEEILRRLPTASACTPAIVPERVQGGAR